MPVAPLKSTTSTPALEIEAPENPAAVTSQAREATNEVAFTIPAGSTVKQTTESVTGEKTNKTTMEFKLEAPTPYRQVTGERNVQSIGAAQKDTSRELGARISAMRPVQWVGVLCILGAAALAYFGWWTKAAIVGGVGIGMIVVAAVIPGNELKILAVGAAVITIGCLAILYAYNKGQLDKYLPDSLDKFPKPKSPEEGR